MYKYNFEVLNKVSEHKKSLWEKMYYLAGVFCMIIFTFLLVLATFSNEDFPSIDYSYLLIIFGAGSLVFYFHAFLINQIASMKHFSEVTAKEVAVTNAILIKVYNEQTAEERRRKEYEGKNRKRKCCNKRGVKEFKSN